MDQQWSNTQHGVPVAGLRPGNGPALERGSLNGDDLHFGGGGRGRRMPSTQPESHVSGVEEEWMGPVLQGLQAKGDYQRRLADRGNSPLYSSPRSPGTRGFFGTEHPRGQKQDKFYQDEQSHTVTTARSPGTPHRQSTRVRNCTSSETEQGSRGSRGPSHRKRGLSKTEGRPKWDNTKMSGLECLATENIWFDKSCYDNAERRFYEGANGPASQQQVKTAMQPAKGRPQKRQHRNSSSNTGSDQELISRMKSLELENHSLYKVVEEMRAALQKLESRVSELEKSPAGETISCAKAIQTASGQKSNIANGGGDDDDDMDLFGSDEDDAEAERVKQERVAAYAAKKAKKPVLIAKSSILLDVKPWDDETDMVKLEQCVRSVQADGLLWGASKLVPVGYGIKKLQINCVVEDDKVGTDMLEEELIKFEDYVQSVDVAAFNKI